MKFLDITDLRPLPSSVLYIRNYEGLASFEEGAQIPVRIVYENHAVGPASIRVVFSEPVDQDIQAAATDYLDRHFNLGS